ncbi:MAG: hypothetical protein HKO77_01740, partial [Gemmatimonadetes bacterium]|nr:hypothetical protein [Gemmatimonadota bacterium]
MKKRVLLSAFVGLLGLPLAAFSQEPNFGRAVVLDDDDLLVGQPVNWYGPGVVYTYRPRPEGGWSEDALLTAPDSSRKDDFGRALALDGNTLVVGAPRKRDGSGVAYVFTRSEPGGAWRSAAVVEPPRPGNHAEYAAALALRGEDLLIGSPATASTGVVYHFTREGDGWGLA